MCSLSQRLKLRLIIRPPHHIHLAQKKKKKKKKKSKKQPRDPGCC